MLQIYTVEPMIAEADRPTPVPIPNSLSPFESGYAKLIVTPP